MNRKQFIKRLGLAGMAFTIPGAALPKSVTSKTGTGGACNLIPSETAGPFPLDLSDNTFYHRQDVREDREGAPLRLRMKIFGTGNCLPMQNVRVNIWHCDKDGNYSGYNNQSAFTYLRGYQMTDAEGEAEFLTVFPGWYNGRVCHIHFQVYVSPNYAAISQLTFDHDAVNDVYADNPSLYTKGPDPKTPATDNIFSDGYDLQVATLEWNPDTEEYDSYLEVNVQGDGVSGLSNLEKETAKYLSLGQNYPNPFEHATTIPFALKESGKVRIELWGLNGKLVKTMDLGSMPAGEYNHPVNLKALSLPTASYLYQLVVENKHGIYKDVKRMSR